MKKYALYTCNASNHKNFITEDYHGNPFLRKIDAIDYGKNMQGTSVYLVTMSKDIELIKVQYRNITMDYKEKYEQALERAKAYHNDYTKDIVEEIFPELKESEDERIRKAIIEFFELQDENTTYSFVKRNEILAWLEKQCNVDSQVILTTFTFDDILALQCCMETIKKVQEDKDLYEKLNDLHSRVYDAYHFEKQGNKPQGKEALETIKEEKVDNANKIEPKFNEGDGSVKIIFPNESDGGEIQICDQSFDRSMSFIFAENMMLHEFQNFLTICRIKKEIEL